MKTLYLYKYTADNVTHTTVYAADTAHTTICCFIFIVFSIFIEIVLK